MFPNLFKKKETGNIVICHYSVVALLIIFVLRMYLLHRSYPATPCFVATKSSWLARLRVNPTGNNSVST